MIPPLYEHQKKIIAEDKKKVGLFMGTGSAKTRTALELAEGKVLVICPKQQREDRTWQRNAEEFGLKLDLTVISKEDLRSGWQKLDRYDTVIIDEVHCNLGISPMPKQKNGKSVLNSSQIFSATLQYLRNHPPKRFYPCSATPTPKPLAMWGIAKLFGEEWDFYTFRSRFYKEIRVGINRRIWVDKKDDVTKSDVAKLVQKFGYTGSLNDFFDVPEQTHRTVHIEPTTEQKKAMAEITYSEADPLVRRSRLRTIENGVLYGKKIESTGGKEDILKNKVTIFPSKKIDYILERAIEFPKLLIFANYTAQIMEIAKALEGYNVSILTGATKDRANLILDAEKAKEAIVIAQCSISSGYELPSFPCVIYASKSWQYVHYEQSLGRVLRSNHLKKNLYIHLVVKGCDEDCHKAIMSRQDFQEKLTLNI